MSIEAQVTVTLADTMVSDEYMVELGIRADGELKWVTLEPDQAAQLAQELLDAATRAVETMAADVAAWSRPVAHGFDVDAPGTRQELAQAAQESSGVSELHPCDSTRSGGAGPSSVICPGCADGHHGACVGSALVERGDTVDEVPCACGIRHTGGAS